MSDDARELWTADQCAEYLGYAHTRAWRTRARREHVEPVEDSPTFRWDAAEVRALTLPRRRRPNFTAAEKRRMRVMYLRHNMSCSQIAAELGIAHLSTVYMVLTREGVPMRPVGQYTRKS